MLRLSEAIEHCGQRELATQTTLLVAAVGMARQLTAALIDLNPSGFDVARGAQRLADVVCPDVCGETVVGVIGHPDDVILVVPGDRDKNRPEDFLAGQSPVVRALGEDGRPQAVCIENPIRLDAAMGTPKLAE